MKRREFIKLLATATAAPIVILKAKPVAPEFVPPKEFAKGVAEQYGKSPMLGDTLETGSGLTYKKYRYIRLESDNELHKIISEEFQARNGKRWMQVYGPRQVKVII